MPHRHTLIEAAAPVNHLKIPKCLKKSRRITVCSDCHAKFTDRKGRIRPVLRRNRAALVENRADRPHRFGLHPIWPEKAGVHALHHCIHPEPQNILFQFLRPFRRNSLVIECLSIHGNIGTTAAEQPVYRRFLPNFGRLAPGPPRINKCQISLFHCFF